MTFSWLGLRSHVAPLPPYRFVHVIAKVCPGGRGEEGTQTSPLDGRRVRVALACVGRATSGGGRLWKINCVPLGWLVD